MPFNSTQFNQQNLKKNIKDLKISISNEFHQKRNISSITHRLVNEIDKILIKLFHTHLSYHKHTFCLLALGSYGRRELQLHSDIDLLLLHVDEVTEEALCCAQLFIQNCWDIGLEISHQITTVNACAELAAQDLSFISSILDMHLMCGQKQLMEELIYRTQPLHMWTSHDYFFAKCQEQHKRYAKYDDTAYNLEPNVKYGPGGLRDLQMVLSIGKRQVLRKH